MPMFKGVKGSSVGSDAFIKAKTDVTFPEPKTEAYASSIGKGRTRYDRIFRDAQLSGRTNQAGMRLSSEAKPKHSVRRQSRHTSRTVAKNGTVRIEVREPVAMLCHIPMRKLG